MLITPRLELVAATQAHLEAELTDPQNLGALLGAAVDAAWPPGEYDRDAMAYFHAQLEAGGPTHQGWYGWYAITRGETQRRLIAGAGYFGPPANGSVEIGYSVIPAAHGQGYATEIVTALVEHAFQQAQVVEVLARTTDANLSSTRVLLRCGFQRTGPGEEPDIIGYRRQR